MEPKAKRRLRSKGSELGPAPRVAPSRREGAAAAVGDLSAAAAAASISTGANLLGFR
jgi:hypothetical protein